MMDIRIYQINTGRDKDRVKFTDLESARKYGGDGIPKAESYDKVFDSKVECNDLEDVYQFRSCSVQFFLSLFSVFIRLFLRRELRMRKMY